MPAPGSSQNTPTSCPRREGINTQNQKQRFELIMQDRGRMSRQIVELFKVHVCNQTVRNCLLLSVCGVIKTGKNIHMW